MIERKIFNYESKILIQKTIEKFGYHPDTFGRSSGKFIIATCRYCGKPHEIRKGFFNKSGSACHKECRIKELKQQKSPFLDPAIRKKSEQTNLKRYGTKQASASKMIADKISKTKKSKEHKERVKKTNLERYGVENPFQAENTKKKIRETNQKKYGVSHPMQNKKVQDKAKKTVQERYGVDYVFQNNDIRQKTMETNLEKYGKLNPMQNKEIQKKALDRFQEAVLNDTERYKLINILRGDKFWKCMAENKLSLHQLCDEFSIDYQSATAKLLDEEFKEKYYKLYTFPRQQQREIRELIENMDIKTSYNNRRIISPLELDVFISSENFAIEFNGNYWHSEAYLDPDKAKMKHLIKTRICQQKGIRLLHIFEQRWNERKKQYISFIRNILKKNDTKIHARKCTIDHSDSNQFIEDNHIQGKPRGVIKHFNLIYENEVVAAMTASRHHRQNASSDQVVLSRLCCKGGCNIQGGASKLFSGFIKWAQNNGYKKIISWSDNSWTYGDIYPVLGFILMKEYEPDYFYWDMNNRRYISKQSQQKKKTKCPKGMTEREWCLERRLYRIWDCGKKLWVYNT